MKILQKQNSSLKQKYSKILECSLIFSLILVAFLFYSFKSFEHENNLPIILINDFEVFDIPQTWQDKPKPPPSRPPYPVESEIDDPLSPDLKIEFPEQGLLASLGNPPPLPQLDEPDVWQFELVEEKLASFKK